MDRYYFEKIERGLIFTRRNINPMAEPVSMHKGVSIPITSPHGPDYWSRINKRYRTHQEQLDYINRGCVDIKLEELKGLQ